MDRIIVLPMAEICVLIFAARLVYLALPLVQYATLVVVE